MFAPTSISLRKVEFLKVEYYVNRGVTEFISYIFNTFEIWCWRRMEKISWTDHVKNEEVLFRVNEPRNILHEIRKR